VELDVSVARPVVPHLAQEPWILDDDEYRLFSGHCVLDETLGDDEVADEEEHVGGTPHLPGEGGRPPGDPVALDRTDPGHEVQERLPQLPGRRVQPVAEPRPPFGA